MNRPHYTLDELLAEAKESGQYPLPPEQHEWLDAPPPLATSGRPVIPLKATGWPTSPDLISTDFQ